MKVYEAVLDQLIGGGVRHFAGMVGSTNAPYAGSLAQRNDARYIGVRHEHVAASMMDATARLSGRPGFVMTHGASGLLAASLGIASTALDSVPMIALSTTQERQAMEKGWWQTSSVLGPLSDTAKWQMRVERPDQAVGAVRQALRESVTGKPGVAQIDIPIDVSTGELADTALPDIAPHKTPLHRPWPGPGAIDACIALIRDARRPVLLIGGGAAYSEAGEALLTLAERLHVPVVNTPTSRSVVPETHDLVLGPPGIVGYEPIGDAIREADLILAIGSRLSDIQTSRGSLLPEDAPIVQVDIDGAAIGREYTPALGVVADARAFTEGLNRALDSGDFSVPDARRDWVASLTERVTAWYAAWHDATPDNGKVQPQELVRAMGALPPETIFTHGAGDHGFFGFMVPVAAPGAHLMSTRLGAMGCALGAALGAKLERPDQTVVACVGDGDFMLQLGDIETMVREQLPAIVVVFNNFRLGSQRKRVEAYGPAIGVDHGNPDFAKLAELFGCRGFRVDQPGMFGDVLQEAVSSGAPCIIDAITDPEARPPRTAISQEAR